MGKYRTGQVDKLDRLGKNGCNEKGITYKEEYVNYQKIVLRDCLQVSMFYNYVIFFFNEIATK